MNRYFKITLELETNHRLKFHNHILGLSFCWKQLLSLWHCGITWVPKCESFQWGLIVKLQTSQRFVSSSNELPLLQPPLPGGAGVGAAVPRDGAPQQHLIPPRPALPRQGGGAGGGPGAVALQPRGGRHHAGRGCRHIPQIQPPQTGIV